MSFLSPRRLDLRILCEYGACIKDVLGSWPTLRSLPLVTPSRESKPMSRNVMIPLRHPDRICEIDHHDD